MLIISCFSQTWFLWLCSMAPCPMASYKTPCDQKLEPWIPAIICTARISFRTIKRARMDEQVFGALELYWPCQLLLHSRCFSVTQICNPIIYCWHILATTWDLPLQRLTLCSPGLALVSGSRRLTQAHVCGPESQPAYESSVFGGQAQQVRPGGPLRVQAHPSWACCPFLSFLGKMVDFLALLLIPPAVWPSSVRLLRALSHGSLHDFFFFF